jgi:glutaredoxin
MAKSVFYHAGCPVCVGAEQTLLEVLDRSKCAVEVVHLGEDRSRIAEAENLGVKSVPALVIDNNVLHMNYGASIEDVKKG